MTEILISKTNVEKHFYIQIILLSLKYIIHPNPHTQGASANRCQNKMKKSQSNQSEEVIDMDYDVVYEINGQQIIQTRRRVMTCGDHQANIYIYDPKITPETIEFIWKIYPRFGQYEAFLPANSCAVKINSKERFDAIVARIEQDKKLHP